MSPSEICVSEPCNLAKRLQSPSPPKRSEMPSLVIEGSKPVLTCDSDNNLKDFNQSAQDLTTEPGTEQDPYASPPASPRPLVDDRSRYPPPCPIRPRRFLVPKFRDISSPDCEGQSSANEESATVRKDSIRKRQFDSKADLSASIDRIFSSKFRRLQAIESGAFVCD
eukprot:CAMPEP_0181295272 /NCGR_PEP_ID=MMETSP1101-20121128/4055_1 /TAXON_ID=46948 /ORGANISM="Rhodomonas abbreviata, Strain Caron Lab Isolate" /LENGTH=166 /DNA_ID=CAMNT_0023400005 /DNA_START=122 /DNA_END=622 /DNA_ORIENTATION=+